MSETISVPGEASANNKAGDLHKGHHRRKKPNCQNCGYQFGILEADEFCPQCGQENTDFKVGFFHLVAEFLEGVLHLDGKLWVTLQSFFLHPGAVPRQYIEGRRNTFSPPIRLYLFVSFVFFLCLGFSGGPQSKITGVELAREPDSALTNIETSGLAQFDSLTLSIGELRQIYLLNNHGLDSLMEVKGIKKEWSNRFFLRQIARLQVRGTEEFMHSLLKNFSMLAFLLLPIFAFILSLIYRRKKLYYSEHFVYSIYMHTFTFILILIFMFLGKWINAAFLIPVLYGALIVYYFLSLRHFYKDRFWKALVKFFLIGILYVLVFFSSLVVGLIYSVSTF